MKISKTLIYSYLMFLNDSMFTCKFSPFRNIAIPAAVVMKDIATIIKFPGDNHFNRCEFDQWIMQ